MSNPNDPKRLLILVEPTPADIENWPFLGQLGGLMCLGRHPVLIHYCNCYNAYAIFRQKLAVMDSIGIDPKSEEYCEIQKKKHSCHYQLQILKSGSGMFKMYELEPGGIFFTDPDFKPDV